MLRPRTRFTSVSAYRGALPSSVVQHAAAALACCWRAAGVGGGVHASRPASQLVVLLLGLCDGPQAVLPHLPHRREPEQALRLGWAHGALLTTFPGDTTMARLPEVEALAKGGTARVQR